MNNEKIAKIVHEVNKAYCTALGDNSLDIWEETALNIRESAINGVAHLNKNPDASPKDMHDNWVKFKTAEGWVYGEHKSIKHKIHPCLVDYDKLPNEQKVKDRLFIAIVRIMTDCVY